MSEQTGAVVQSRNGPPQLWTTTPMTRETWEVLVELAQERIRQREKHGDQSHLLNGTGPYALGGLIADGRHRYAAGLARWAKERTDAASQGAGDGTVTFEHILTEEWAEAMTESDPEKLRAELVQVAAVAIQWVEALDTRYPRTRSAEAGGRGE